ncbi:CUB and zona pellucida-like domain-containing protein 1 [Mercenaria mercenaria]|uniref:CUB and zona pellucida-like domain-containing protein 1 n=1 Tax=Mercenaria mercenaria TaxID=6596 RepID=UPI001E1DC7F0|nr:CUB and zona pellucida-like domain-containing protein 1 [Mercenaria mercenaria]
MTLIKTLVLFVCLPNVCFTVPGCPSKAMILKAEQAPQFLWSPNHPGYYGVYNSRLTCLWLITAGSIYDDVVIQIKVLNSSIEPATGCWRDVVSLFDGPRDFYRPLKSWCGYSWPKDTITSSGDRVLVKFTTDFKLNDYYGFMLAYWVAKKPVFIVNAAEWSAANYILMVISVLLLTGGPAWVFGLYIKRELYPKILKYRKEN